MNTIKRRDLRPPSSSLIYAYVELSQDVYGNDSFNFICCMLYAVCVCVDKSIGWPAGRGSVDGKAR